MKAKVTLNETRPRKTGTAKRQRTAIQKRRLAELGVPAELIPQLNPRQIRDFLRSPKKTLAQFAA